MGSARHQATLMHRVHIICVLCATIHYTPDSCNCEPCLTVSVCFRRINHMAVKNHLHSSSGVREVVSSTVHTLKCLYLYQTHFYKYSVLNIHFNLCVCETYIYTAHIYIHSTACICMRPIRKLPVLPLPTSFIAFTAVCMCVCLFSCVCGGGVSVQPGKYPISHTCTVKIILLCV